MKILYHHRTLGDGAEGIHVREMVAAFRSLGHVVKVVGPAGETQPEASKKFRVLDNLKRRIPSVVYELLELGYTFYSFFKVLYEWVVFRPDFIYDRYITFNAGVVLAGRLLKIPVYLEVNAPLALERSGESDERLVFKRLAAGMERWICAHASRVIVVSTPLKEYLVSIGVPAEKCVVMPNGADPDKFRPRSRRTDLAESLGIPEGVFTIGFTGVLRPWHGLDLLIEAVGMLVARGKQVALLIVGDGPYRGVVEQLARERSLEHLLFITGRVPHDKVADYISLFDVAVSPRATFYASPMKVIEYMGLGKAVVVPGSQNFLDIVDADINGVTFAAGDAVDMARALEALHDAREKCVQLGTAAREKVEKRLNWRWNATEVCNFLTVSRSFS
jgi:glycosyltransferase involved in cell wall biosynthesis